MSDLAAEFMRRLRASLGGYLWLPCPRCGRMFGGYERGGHVDLGEGKGLMTCKECPDVYDLSEMPKEERKAALRSLRARAGFKEAI